MKFVYCALIKPGDEVMESFTKLIERIGNALRIKSSGAHASDGPAATHRPETAHAPEPPAAPDATPGDVPSAPAVAGE
jgi:hypothetical protein